MSPAHDDSIVELGGPTFEWLGPGGRLTIDDVEYEYADSDADDDSIDDAVGPGRTFGKLVKRVAAPVEMFLSFCSDLLGNGPNATFTRLMRRQFPWSIRSRRTRNLSWWLGNWLYVTSMVSEDNDEIWRLIQFVIDRRYNFSVRLTAAYYLLILLQSLRSFQLSHILPLVHNPLLRLCQEGFRRGINSSILQPLEEVVTLNEDLKRIANCGLEETPGIVIGSSGSATSLQLLHRQLFGLYYEHHIRTRSDLEAMEHAQQVIHSSLCRPTPTTNPFTSALTRRVWLDDRWLESRIDEDTRAIRMKEFLEHLQYVIPCGPGYGSRYTSEACNDPGMSCWGYRANALDSMQNLCPGCKHPRCPLSIGDDRDARSITSSLLISLSTPGRTLT
ncbi:hypothetical protein OE88DRAFT_1662603 [Heliocybe sulcata]|uniref:Uncharacterized protein n=1 Tax=Heliocybe sulcata TaxID=5364 RepID=A0A5C3N635_9AGAM|nr:hypothetical protein OE88DRAFT_1662603 [Heliocybe sulcata]